MSGGARVDFRGEVTLSTWGLSDSTPVRVLMNDDQLVFASEDRTERVDLSDVFDVSEDVPATAGPDATATVSIGFERGASRETATVEYRAETLADFQFCLFRSTLGGTAVKVSQTGEVENHLDGTAKGRLKVSASDVRFDCGSEVLSVGREEMDMFETTRGEFGGESDRPVVVLYSTREERALRTSVCFPSFRCMNLFGRFLQSSPEAGTNTSTDPGAPTHDVLVVDDDSGDLEMIELMLQRYGEGLETETTTSAVDGMKALDRGSFDCVVSDYDMPGVDGIEFLEQVREPYPDLPFILFTGQGSEAVAKQAIISDVTDYVEKGIGSQQYKTLVARIRKALR